MPLLCVDDPAESDGNLLEIDGTLGIKLALLDPGRKKLCISHQVLTTIGIISYPLLCRYNNCCKKPHI